jgi:hypothetical protein
MRVLLCRKAVTPCPRYKANPGSDFATHMKTIYLLMVIVLCQFSIPREAFAETREEARAQAMIESLQEQKAQSERNPFAHAKGKLQIDAEQGGQSSGGTVDIFVALAGASMVLLFGYLEWSDSRQWLPARVSTSPANENVQKLATRPRAKAPTGSRSRELSDHHSRIPGTATRITTVTSNCDLLRHLVCQHAKTRGNWS